MGRKKLILDDKPGKSKVQEDTMSSLQHRGQEIVELEGERRRHDIGSKAV